MFLTNLLSETFVASKTFFQIAAAFKVRLFVSLLIRTKAQNFSEQI
jgi:hypothetical protein